MATLDDLTFTTSWRDVELFAESVPHLLHWDLAYLSILTRGRDVRPLGWEKRVAAWKRLISLFLLGRLETKRQDLQEPFAECVRRFGLDGVVWLYASGSVKPIGVLSPTVLVRPLPDYRDGEHERWPEVVEPNSTLTHFAALAIRQLEELGNELAGKAAEISVPRRLASILKVEFSQPVSQPGYRSRVIDGIIAPTVRWLGLPDALTSIQVLVSSGERRSEVILPRCAGCKTPLTQKISDQAVPVDDTEITLPCPECNREQRIDERLLMIWFRNREEVVVWTDRQNPGEPTSAERFPAPVGVSGSTVTYEWDAAQVAGDRNCRYLRLDFGNRVVRTVAFRDTLYKRLLVLRSDEEFGGLPVRGSWRDAFLEPLSPKAGSTGFKFHCCVRGWPFTFELHRTNVREVPGVALGVFPRFLSRAWHQYRVFTAGLGNDDTVIQVDGSHAGSKCSWQVDVDTWPRHVAVSLRSDPDTGCSFDVPSAIGSEKRAEQLVMGIDFGTTSSVVYHQHLRQERTPNSEDAVYLHDVVNAVLELAGDLANVGADGYPASLPLGVHPEENRSLFPSALWSADGFQCIRWTNCPPCSGAVPEFRFKWDHERSREEIRQIYLKELLFLTIPAVLLKRNLTTTNHELTLSWSFPLAFGNAERESAKRVWSDFKTALRERFGFTKITLASIDESRANVQAFGSHNVGETFLVADMGGSTIDVALITYGGGRAVTYEQIGSVRFGGEMFLDAYLRRWGSDIGADYWELRRSIEHSTDAHPPLVRGEDGLKLFERQLVIAFELLRTMCMTFCKVEKRRVQLVLVGNGWRLMEAVHPQANALGPQSIRQRVYEDLRTRTGLDEMVLTPKYLPTDTSKHHVAQGCITHAKSEARSPTSGVEFSKLPAGRPVSLTIGDRRYNVTWNTLVGSDCEIEDWNLDELKGAQSDFDFSEAAPMPPSWRRLWEKRVLEHEPQSGPDGSVIRHAFLQALGGPPAFIGKGPLQLLMEHHWSRVLEGVQ